jgi:hypothetical protein
VAGFQELRHKRLADKSSSSDNQAIHGRAFMDEHSWATQADARGCQS